MQVGDVLTVIYLERNYELRDRFVHFLVALRLGSEKYYYAEIIFTSNLRLFIIATLKMYNYWKYICSSKRISAHPFLYIYLFIYCLISVSTPAILGQHLWLLFQSGNSSYNGFIGHKSKIFCIENLQIAWLVTNIIGPVIWHLEMTYFGRVNAR